MTQAEIYQQMVECIQQETGYELRETGDMAVRLQAVAAQIMGLYHYGTYIYEQAFPQTAQGESLDLHGQRRGLSRLTEQKATGVLRFSISSELAVPLVIDGGTICLSGDGTAFETLADAMLLAGSLYVDVEAQAVESGSQGNVAAGTITVMQTRPEGVETVTNPQRFAGGREQETDENYRNRILESYKGLNNGANSAYYRELALSVDGIDGVSVVPKINGAGSVGLLVTSNSGKVTTEVMNTLNTLLEDRRELGIEVVVQEPEYVAVVVEGLIVPAEGYTTEAAQTAVETAISEYISGLKLGKILYRSALCYCAMATGAIDDIAISWPPSDVSPEVGQQLVPGSITLEGN